MKTKKTNPDTLDRILTWHGQIKFKCYLNIPVTFTYAELVIANLPTSLKIPEEYIEKELSWRESIIEWYTNDDYKKVLLPLSLQQRLDLNKYAIQHGYSIDETINYISSDLIKTHTLNQLEILHDQKKKYRHSTRANDINK